MNKSLLKIAIEKGCIEWQKHALERMMERGISREIVKQVLLTGEVIEDYPADKPYPSALILGWFEGEPFHIVTALDSISGYCFIITAYKPDIEHFEADFKTRRKDDN